MNVFRSHQVLPFASLYTVTDITHNSEADFWALISSGRVVVHFYSTVNPCDVNLVEFSNRYPHIKFVKVEVQGHLIQIAFRMRITSVPTLRLIQDGRRVRHVSKVNAHHSELVDWLSGMELVGF